MAYLLLFQGRGLQGNEDEYVVIADIDDVQDDEVVKEFGASGYDLVEKIEILDDVRRWPTDRSLRSR